MFARFAIVLTLVSPIQTFKAPSDSELYNNYKDSVVWVGNSDWHGSGYIVKARSGKKVIVTNAHVCDHEDSDLVVKYDDDSQSKEVAITLNKQNDLCLVSLQDQDKPALDLSDSTLEIGDEVTTEGYPGNQPKRLNKGRVVAFDNILVDEYMRPSYIITAKIEPGQSGSPLFNTRGQVVGTIYAGNGVVGAALPSAHLNAILRRY